PRPAGAICAHARRQSFRYRAYAERSRQPADARHFRPNGPGRRPGRLLMPAMIDAPDLETRAAPDDHHALRLWLRMLTCCNLIESDLRGRLRTEFDTTLPRFDLMAQLQRAPKGMKMG